MFRLDVFIRRTEMRSELPSHGLAFDSFLFTGAASLTARMSTTVQASFAHAEALWLFDGTLVADSVHGVATTPTTDQSPTHTSTTGAGVADLLTRMSTWQGLPT